MISIEILKNEIFKIATYRLRDFYANIYNSSEIKEEQKLYEHKIEALDELISILRL